MASEIFLKLTDVKGESKGKDHEGEIDVQSMSLGLSNPSSISTGGGAGTGKADFAPISIMKSADLASSTLFLNCAQGVHFDEGTITIREAGGQTPLEYIVIKLTQVFIDSINWGESSGGGKPMESVSLSYATIDIVYWSQDAKGGKGDKTEIGWDVKANTSTASA
jgi:type VI secretion system secreted protein Hcp